MLSMIRRPKAESKSKPGKIKPHDIDLPAISPAVAGCAQAFCEIDPAGETSHSRPEIVLSGLLYLMSTYAQRPSHQLAVCVVCHLRCLADHPALDPVLRHMCEKIESDWRTGN